MLNNHIPFVSYTFQDEMTEYIRLASNQVRRRHSRTRKGMPTKRKDARGRLPDATHCALTGVRFVDAETDTPNPNDPRKRTIDHKVPLSECFIRGWTQEQANDVSNLMYVLRAVNNQRQSTHLENYKVMADWYRQKFIESGVDATDETWYNK